MGLPQQKRFTLQNVADQLRTAVSHVEEMVSTGTFKYVIVEGEMIGGAPLTRHVYFDPDLFRQQHHLFRQQHPEQPVLLTKKEKQKDKKEKQRMIERMVDQIRSSNAKHRDRTVHEVFTKAVDAKIEKIQNDIPEKHTRWNIGPNEVALLWPSSQPWRRPQGAEVFIPRLALVHFEKAHGALKEEKENEVNAAKQKERRAAVDPSNIDQKKLYGSAEAAELLGYEKHYFQNSETLRDKLGATKIGGRWRYPGQNLINYLQGKSPQTPDR